MAITKAKKQELVAKLSAELNQAGSAIVATFGKLTVAQDFELRKTVRSAGGRYRVVKNKLVERAAQGTQLEAALKDLAGVTSIAFTAGDPVALAKALQKYIKDNPEFSVKAGILQGRVLTVTEVSALATLPSRDELMSKLLFLINSPAQRLATVMGATGRDLAVVVNQGVQENKFAAQQ
jgi:large subunit ribosomal protein L10